MNRHSLLTIIFVTMHFETVSIKIGDMVVARARLVEVTQTAVTNRPLSPFSNCPFPKPRPHPNARDCCQSVIRFFEMVVVVRLTRVPSASVSPILPSLSQPIASLSFSENLGVFVQQKGRGGECSITVPTTTWLAPGYTICTVLQTVLPCGSVVTASTCPGGTETTTILSESSSPAPIPPPYANDQQSGGPTPVPGDYSQGKLNGIIIGTVLAVIIVVLAVFLWGNKRLIRKKMLRRPIDDESVELEGPPRRPNGDRDDAGGGAPPEAPAPAPAQAGEPAAAPEPAPDPPPAPEPAADAPAAPPPAALDLALLPPAALVADAAHAPPTPYPSPSGEPSDDEGYVYRRRRLRRSSSESRVRFAEEPDIIPDRRPWRGV